MVDSRVAEFLEATLFAAGPEAVSLVEVVARVLAHDKLAHLRDLRLERAFGVVLDLFLEGLSEEVSGLLFGLVLLETPLTN